MSDLDDALEDFGAWWDSTGPFAGKGATMKGRKTLVSRAGLKEGVACKSWREIFNEEKQALLNVAKTLTL